MRHKISVQRGRTSPGAIVIAEGVAEAQSDTISVNIDAARLPKGDALLMIDTAIRTINSAVWPLRVSGGTPTPTPTPELVLTPGAASITTEAAAGATIAAIGNVPAGVTPALSPADARLAIAGSTLAGWRVVRGLGAVTAGSIIAYTVAAAGAASVSGEVAIEAGSSGDLTLVTAPVTAQSETHLTLTSAGVYSGGTVSARSYILYRNGVHSGPVTLPYAKAPLDAQASLAVREIATAGALTGTGMSNAVVAGGTRPALYALDFSAFPNGTKLRDIPGIVMTGTASQWDGPTIVAGKLNMPAFPDDASPYGFMLETGPGNIDVEWSWLTANAAQAWTMQARYANSTTRLLCQIAGGTDGTVSVHGINSGTYLSNARTRLPIVGSSPWVEADIFRLRTQAGKVYFYQNGTAKLLTASAPAAGESPNDPTDAGLSLGGAAPYISQWPHLQIPANRFLATQIKTLIVRPVDVPVTVSTATFEITENARILSIGALVTVLAPLGYSIRLEAADGTAIVGDTDIALTNASGVMSGTITVPEAALSAYQGQNVTVMLKVKGDPYSCGAKAAPLLHLEAPGVVPLHLGMNGGAVTTWGSTIIERDLATRALWSHSGGEYPIDKIDINRNFPSEYISGGTATMTVLENGVYAGLGQYEITIPAGMTAVPGHTNTNSSISAFVGGKATVTFTGTSDTRTWLTLNLSGPIPADARVTILPKDDPHPERKYHQQLRDLIENGGYEFYRYMIPLRTNDIGAREPAYVTSNRGLDSGARGCRIGTAINLARDTNKAIWWNFYHLCTPDYESAIANAVAHPTTGIPLGQKFHIEYSNEEWNTAFNPGENNKAPAWYGGYDLGTSLADAVPRAARWMGWDMEDLAWYNATRVAGQDAITKIEVPADAYFYVGIGNYGGCVYRSKRVIPVGTTLPYDAVIKVPFSDANADFITGHADLVKGRWRHYMVRAKRIYDTVVAAFVAAGRSANDVVLHCNYQYGGGATLAAQFVSYAQYAGLTPSANVQVSIAPYYSPNLSAYSAPLGASTPMDQFLDGAFEGHVSTMEAFASYLKIWKDAAVVAGAPNAVASIYEVNQHNDGFFKPTLPGGDASKAIGQAREAAWKQDPRAGVLLKAFLERSGQQAPGAVVSLFADVSPKDGVGWGLYNSQAESAAPTNPGAIAIHEWQASCLDKRPTFDIFARTTPQAGSQIVRVIRTGSTTLADTVQLNIAAGTTNGIAAGEVTGGFGNRTISFAAGQIWQDVTISTTNTALRTMRLSLTGLPSGAQIGTLSMAGVTQAVRPA